MTIHRQLLLAIALATDAFAVSVSNGMCYKIPKWKNALACGLMFGLMQGLMPLIGFFAGRTFAPIIESLDHWIALLLLGGIGVKMIYDALKEWLRPEITSADKPFSGRILLVQGIATSIDALTVGITLGIMQVNIVTACLSIAVITCVLSFLGVLVGTRFGEHLSGKAEIMGGVILVVLGVKIFLEHISTM